jgi:uroporphyrinogen decarboxylase
VSVTPTNDRLLRALRGEAVDRTPVWFMRQAGRYLPEYRELRGERDILDAVRDPELVVEATLQPLRRMPLDAAILFSDIMVPIAAVGVPVRIEASRGPMVDAPFRSRGDLSRLRPLMPEQDEPFVLEAIRLLRKELTVPLIGFSGAPFTLASYLVEGGPSRDHAKTKALMLGDPRTWGELMDALVDLVFAHLRAQAEAGVQALQVFDSWVGCLSTEQYARHVGPAMRRLFDEVRGLEIPTIHFGTGTAHLLPAMAAAGGDVLGVDWRLGIDRAWDLVGHDRGIQGNLDPAAALAPWEVLRDEARDVLRRARHGAGHVFNLGHGVLPDTPVENLQRLVDLVHQETER